MSMSNIDRRAFLAGSGSLAAVALAGGASLALASEGADASTSADAPADSAAEEAPAGDAAAGEATQASGNGDRPDYPWAETAPEITDDMVEEEVEGDVIVVGCGVAGCCAIRSAAEEGAKVIWFEKTSGSTAPGRQFAIINSSMNETWGNYGILDRDDVCDHEMDEGGYFAKRSIYTKWFDHVGEVFDWYISLNPDLYVCSDMYDCPPNGEDDGYAAPLCWPQPEYYDFTQERYPTYPSSAALSGRELDAMALEKVASDYGGKGYFGYRAEQLIRDGDRVTGVYAYNYATGKYVKATASKGVILACGDYGANDDFVKYFLPEQYWDNIPRMGFFQDPDGLGVAQGEGLVMGDWIGAKVQEHHALMIHHMGNGPLGCTPFLELNKDGKRFFNEEVPGQQIENQLELQRDMTSYLIFDANWPDAIPYMPAGHGVKCYYIDDDQVDILDGMIEPEAIIYPSAVQAAVDEGSLLSADTLEELFAQIDIDADAALASVERYNEMCANGYDEDFGKSPSRLFPIETGPFYCATFTPAASLVCLGGLESDEDCHVYDRDRNIIPGLYVCGNMQGNRFTVEYPIAVCGIDRSMCVYYGYVAGKNAVAEA
jgi:fumarate reductase flavoprotein subunit